MISEETVFILGAGASVPYGYPTGKGLRKLLIKDYRDIISRTMRNSHENLDNSRLANEQNKYYSLIENYSRSPETSIDLFLARNPDYEKLAKQLIVMAIFESDFRSSFRENLSEDAEGMDWYSLLFSRMTETMISPDSFRNLNNNKIAFITFNYDRSLEHFFFTSLSHAFTRSQDLISSKGWFSVFPFQVIHLYGRLPLLKFEDSVSGIEYRKPISFRNINAYASGIRVIYDRANDAEIEKAQDLIRKAKKVFILGFGYANENLEILGIPDIFNHDQQVFGTALGMTEIEIKRTLIKISNRKGGGGTSPLRNNSIKRNNVILADLDCRMLLREYLH